MASRSERGAHQDYIARIRYSNALPPPPIPPKLLNIPGTGLGDGHYTSAAYASKMAREQPLNIEADAELGMPIDLVGLPGVFDGDDSCLYGFDTAPIPHPHDKPLLKPLSALGKSATNANGVSFLRRTEYIATDHARHRAEGGGGKDTTRHASDARKRRRIDEVPKNDPSRIVPDIEAGFRLATNEANVNGFENFKQTQEASAAWKNPVHPANSNLTLLDAYPLLPDPGANTDFGAYRVVKFQSNPVDSNDEYDKRLDYAVLHPADPPPDRIEDYQMRLAAFQADPTRPDPGPPRFDYMLYLQKDRESADAAKAVIEHRTAQSIGLAGEAEDEDEPSAMEWHKDNLYETYQQAGDGQDTFNDTIALTLYDPEQSGGRLQQKGAYFYPIDVRTSIRPSRSRNVGGAEENDVINITIRPSTENELALRASSRSVYEPQVEVGASTEAEVPDMAKG